MGSNITPPPKKSQQILLLARVWTNGHILPLNHVTLQKREQNDFKSQKISERKWQDINIV